jgi:hypothetical protein
MSAPIILPNCVRATKLVQGCVVMMSRESGMQGYGNPQCVKDVCEPLGEISLYGHNQHYKAWQIERILEYPIIQLETPI